MLFRSTVEVPDDLPLVRGRPQQLQQVLLNLLINAKDALTGCEMQDRRVWLTAAPHADGVRLSVRDNGPGVPAAMRPHIFEPFVTSKRARGGTGLGLSVSKSLLETYGGNIEVVGEPGHGAEFRIWLPIATEE